MTEQQIKQFADAMKNPMPIVNQMGLQQQGKFDPNVAIQQMMNSGRMTQQQFNATRQAWLYLKQNPILARFMK